MSASSTDAAERPLRGNEWLHRLRNELNTIGMAAAAAQLLLERGQPDAAGYNLQRVREACQRCAGLLDARAAEVQALVRSSSSVG